MISNFDSLYDRGGELKTTIFLVCLFSDGLLFGPATCLAEFHAVFKLDFRDLFKKNFDPGVHIIIYIHTDLITVHAIALQLVQVLHKFFLLRQMFLLSPRTFRIAAVILQVNLDIHFLLNCSYFPHIGLFIVFFGHIIKLQLRTTCFLDRI